VPGGAGFTLTVNGTGFVSGSVVKWNGNPRITHFVTDSQVTAEILATDIASATTASVAVTNPAPGGGTSNAAYFSVTVPKTTVPFVIANKSIAGGFGPMLSSDFNGDGKVDLVIAKSIGPSFDVLVGNGDGTFQPPIRMKLPLAPASLTAADFNSDGKLDLAMTEINQAGKIEVLLGNGDGTFQPAQTFLTGQGQGAGIVAADLNGDGKMDLAVADQNVGNVSIFLGNGDGTFFSPTVVAVSATVGEIAVGDFNQDGKLDLAVSTESSSFAPSIAILLGNGDGSFRSGVSLVSNFAGFIVTGDFNHDGSWMLP
jgi:hypothetical protein